MTTTKSPSKGRWCQATGVVAVGAVVLQLVLLGGWLPADSLAAPCRAGSAQATIFAPYEVVWSTLIDTASYPDWNPFVVGFDPPDTNLTQIGTPFVLLVDLPYIPVPRITREPFVVTQVITPGSSSTNASSALLAYDLTSALKGPLGNPSRRQSVTALNATSSYYETREQFCGWLSLAIPFFSVEKGFAESTAALKQEAEARWARQQNVDRRH